jgi:hydroxymethylpyrimidine pyrophosphatase-like HAD family hydrolase
MRIAFDVDGTLVDYDGKPRATVIALLRNFQRLGCNVFVWSGGGIPYAKQRVRELGIDGVVVVEKGSFKPDLAIDDQEVQLGILNFQTNPFSEAM